MVGAGRLLMQVREVFDGARAGRGPATRDARSRWPQQGAVTIGSHGCGRHEVCRLLCLSRLGVWAYKAIRRLPL